MENISKFGSPFEPPSSLGGTYYLHPPPKARAIFLHNDLLCNGMCSVIGGTYRGLKRKKSQNSTRNKFCFKSLSFDCHCHNSFFRRICQDQDLAHHLATGIGIDRNLPGIIVRLDARIEIAIDTRGLLEIEVALPDAGLHHAEVHLVEVAQPAGPQGKKHSEDLICRVNWKREIYLRLS